LHLDTLLLLGLFQMTIVGISPVPTKYRITPKSGMPSFVCCGADIVLTGFYQDLDGEARCPVCECIIHLKMDGGSIISVEPDGALLHYVRCAPRDNSTAFGVACESTFLFDRAICLGAWREGYSGPAGEVTTPRAFFEDFAKTKRFQKAPTAARRNP